jgi:hypothetical protein
MKAGDQTVPSKFFAFERIHLINPVGEEYQAIVRLEWTTEGGVCDLIKQTQGWPGLRFVIGDRHSCIF